MSTPVEIDTKIFNKISKRAKNENTTENKIINEILRKEMESAESKIPDYLIINKDTYDPNFKPSKKLIGVIKTKEPFDTAKAIREIRGIE